MAAKKSSTVFTPHEDRLLVRPVDEAATMRGGLYIPDTAKERPTHGTVLAVGPGKPNETGKVVPLPFSVGDVVVYSKYSNSTIVLDGEELFIVKSGDIHGKLS